ncbi:hypothetical protein P4O66_004029 [Electrophorus voltai]|uniref:Inactive dipeptidyl peptidase 10-like n=1 Tax=Electrophorus voltai TaxID=2609070 RepID=A0AAD8ZQ28_9TELE|nr:hypothetical protein P4O66_004029 [Electrophorus voltai]
MLCSAENEVVLCTQQGHVLLQHLNTNLTTTLLDNSTMDLKSVKIQVSADKRYILMAYNIRSITLAIETSHSMQGKEEGAESERLLMEREREREREREKRGKGTEEGPRSSEEEEEKCRENREQGRKSQERKLGSTVCFATFQGSTVCFATFQVFSLSFTASYVLYTVASGEVLDLIPAGVEVSVLQYAAWGPQENQLIYVFENDIYYKADVSSPAMRLTTSGKVGQEVNGLSDWTYEEEILLKYPAHWWSKDGARLAYLKINNSATPLMEIPHFLGGTYPSNMLYPYPKAGSSIPVVGLFVVNLYGPAHTLEMIPPDSQTIRESYISMVNWITSTRLAVVWLNRVQNQSVLCVCEATTGACAEKHKMAKDLLQDQNQEAPLFSADGSQFYLTLPAKQGASGEFRHIASLPAQPAILSASPRFLTSGNWDVAQLCALDEENSKMYGWSTSPQTCPGVPKVTIHSTGDPSRYTVVEENSLLATSLSVKHLPETLYRTISSDSYDLHLKLSLPPGWLSQLPYIDGRRIALYGKGFGGYLTLKILRATEQMFRCSAVMAPITDFRLYSAAFSERYLGLPGKEEHAYMSASLLEDVHKLKDQNFLLLHGTADARVHFQHSAELLSRLVKVKANYTLQLYPDEGHTFREERSIQHLQRSLLHYFHNCLQHDPLLAEEEEEEEEED